MSEFDTKTKISIPTGKDRISDYDAVYFIHIAIRNDINLYIDVFNKLDITNPETSHWHRSNYTKYTNLFLNSVHSHHHVEDDIFFPYLKKNGIKVDDSLELEHKQVNELLENFEKFSKPISPDSKASDEEILQAIEQLKSIIVTLKDTLFAHLDSEEAIVNKPLRDTIPAKKFTKECISQIIKIESKSPFFTMVLCWFLNADPSHAQEFLNDELPFVPRQLYHNVWIHKFNKEYKNLLISIVDHTVPSPHLESSAGCKCVIM